MASNNSSSAWNEPRCLIGSAKDDQLEVDQETLLMLQKITDPVVVVGIAGLYRTGKSYLMNRLASQQHGFALGSTVQSKTKGIWIWCVPHPNRKNCSLVLIDTEGLGDVEKGNVNHDVWIFALAVLLSSTLVYNSIGTIAQQALNDLHFVTEMAEHIKIKSKQSDEDVVEFDKFFPSFIWAVRDFTLDLEINGKPVTEDDYLEHALQLKSGAGKKISDYNLPRECIRTFFPQRKCFVFPSPVDDRSLLRDLESISDGKLNSEFLQQAQTFVRHVYEMSKVKTVNGRNINGRMLGGLTSCYVEAIRNGAVPCIETAVETTAKLENNKAIQESLDLYKQRFTEIVQLPTEKMLELSDCHHRCEREASEYFMKLAIFDAEKIYYQRLMEELSIAYQNFVEENEAASREKCNSLLDSLHQKIEASFKAGIFACPGGYEKYRRDIDSLVQNYRQIPGKGVMSEEVLCEFMKRQEATSESVLKADEKLTDEARKLEEERQRAEANNREKLVAEEVLRKNEQLMVDQQKSYDEHIKRVERQAEEDRKRIQEQCEEVLEKRLKEQQKLMQEGFDSRAQAMNQEIDSLKTSIEEQKKGGGGLLDFLGGVIGSIFSPFKALNFFKKK